MKNKTQTKQQLRATRIRSKLLSTSTRPRLVVSRSNSHIFSQVLDSKGHVLAAFGSQSLKGFKGNKTSIASEVGKRLGEIAKANKVSEVIFDRGSYRFHGRVKALAEAARATGLKF